jgi:hypothetical protein
MGLDADTAKLRAQIFVWAGGRSHGADMQWRHDVLKHLVEIISPQETTGN